MSVQSNSPTVDTTKELDKDDVIELLGEEVEEKEEKEVLELTPEKKVTKKDEEAGEEKEDEEEKDELAEIEEELEEPTEDKLELVTPVRRREILAKYPDLFKTFPYLEKAYYREQKFTELFPTPADAQVASEKAETLDNFEHAIMDGSLEAVLSAAKDESKETFNKIVDNYLPNLLAVDQQAYYHVIGNVVKDTIITMAREAKSLGEEGAPLLSAANILNQFVFGTSKFEPPKLIAGVEKKDDPREKELQEREQAIIMDRFEESKETLQTKVSNVLKATIDGNIDPKDSMTGYVKKNASREAYEMLEELIEKDSRFSILKDKLWEKAFQEGFSKSAMDRIKAAYLSKAKTLLPSVIKKARNEALKGIGKRVQDDTEETSSSTSERRTPSSNEKRPISMGKIKSAKEIPADKSTLDLLNMD